MKWFKKIDPFSEILAFDFHISKHNPRIMIMNRFTVWIGFGHTNYLIISFSKSKIYTFIFQEEEKKEADDKEAEVKEDKPTEAAPAVPVEAPPAAPVEAPPAPVEAPPAPLEEPAAPAPVVEEAALPAPPPVVEATEEKTIEKTDVETKEPDTEAPAAAPEVAAAAPETTGEE